jgi:antitoxin component YwqK of YwqJK toxin-antitoxin module
MRLVWTGRSSFPFSRVGIAAPTLAGAALCVLALGCGYGNVHKNFDNTPDMMTGVGATIIMPGQSAPPLPTPGVTNSQGRTGPGSSSGSAGSQGMGAGGGGSQDPTNSQYPYAPGAGGAYPSGQGAMPQEQAPGGNQPSPGNMVFIGGVHQDEQTSYEHHNEPVWLKPLLFPFALVAYPFTKASEALSGDDNQNGPAVPRSNPQPARPLTHEEMQARQEADALGDLQHQLEQRGQAPQTDPGSASLQASATPGGGASAPSIAEELAALQARRDGRPLPQVQQPAQSPTAAGAPSQVQAATSTGSGVADLVEDRNHDGRPDHWVYREGGRIVREAFDDHGKGVPDRILYYDATGTQVVRSEEDTNGDGRIDTWTDYRNGQIVNRRADTDGDGMVDTWTFYHDGQVVRLEQDTDGDGMPDRIEFYEGGHRVREERDRNGKPVAITYFDKNDQPTQRDEDTDGDGVLDMRSYYSGGKLVRREVMNEAALSAATGMKDPTAAPPAPAREPGT